MGDVEKRDIEVTGLTLFDISSVDDCLIASSPCGFNELELTDNQIEHSGLELLDAEDANKVEKTAELMGQEKNRKAGKCNTRKSLAWDSAFFSNAGVLDPEELSSIIEGVETAERNSLQGIQEDVHGSTESISTLESDSLTLQSIEADLFQDIRASIQKSSKASIVANYSKEGSAEKESANACTSSKLDLTSRSRLQLSQKTASKKPNNSLQGAGRVIKQGSVNPPQFTKPSTKGGATVSFPKPPKVSSSLSPASTVPTRRASLAASRAMENDDAKETNVAGKGAIMSKRPGVSDSRKIVPRPARPIKSSTSSYLSTTKSEPTSSCSSLSSSGSASSSVRVNTSSLNSMRRKIDSKIVNTATQKTPLKNRSQTVNSRVSSYLKSASKPSSSVSPSSSISEWSSESCSSTSTINQVSNSSKVSLGNASSSKRTSLGNGASQELSFQDHSSDEISVGHENKEKELLSQGGTKAMTESGTRSNPPSVKPSGLRMPSPKIGFFDGVRSGARTPNESIPSHLSVPTGLSKIGMGICSPQEGLNKGIGKLQHTKISAPPSYMKIEISPKTSNRYQLKIDEVGTKGSHRAKPVTPSSFKGDKNGNISALKSKLSSEVKGSAYSKNVKITPVKEDKEMLLLSESNKTEKAQSEEAVNALREPMGVINEKPEIQTEMTGGSVSQNAINIPDGCGPKGRLSNSPSPVPSGITAEQRALCSAKNPLCNGDGLGDLCTGSKVEVVDGTPPFPGEKSARDE